MKLTYFLFILIAFNLSCELNPEDSKNPLDPKNVDKEPLSIFCLTEYVSNSSICTVYWKNDFIHKNVNQIEIGNIIVDISSKKLILPASSRYPNTYRTIPQTYEWTIPKVEIKIDRRYAQYYLRIKLLTSNYYMKDIILAEDELGLNMISLNDHISAKIDYSNKYQGNYNIQVTPGEYFNNFDYIKIIWKSIEETDFQYISLLIKN